MRGRAPSSFCWPPESVRAESLREMVEPQGRRELVRRAPRLGAADLGRSVSAGTIRFSITVMRAKQARHLKGARNPAAGEAYSAGMPAISTHRDVIEPLSGSSAPATKLIVVVLPEPFGPIRPTSLAALSAIDKSSTA